MDALEERVDSLETTFARYMTQTGTMIERLDRNMRSKGLLGHSHFREHGDQPGFCETADAAEDLRHGFGRLHDGIIEPGGGFSETNLKRTACLFPIKHRFTLYPAGFRGRRCNRTPP
jgi:hypothetical protein